MRGDVYATGRIELAAQARVQGNIYYQVVEMAAGAMISGRLIHGEAPPKQLPKPEIVKDRTDKELAEAAAQARDRRLRLARRISQLRPTPEEARI